MIQKAAPENLRTLAGLALQLWPHHTQQELEEEFSQAMENENAVFFLKIIDGKALGFAQCQLRRDYVEGTETSPVGYLEGIYVVEGYRSKGIAQELLSACENWAKEKGCREFASDCELTNSQSLSFHLRVGFEEANRIICFTKQL